MLTEIEMLEIAKSNVKKMETEVELAILENLSIKKDYGTIFFYNTKQYVETRDDIYNTLVGNAPFLIENKTGKIISFGTSRSEEYYIQEYEANRWPIE